MPALRLGDPAPELSLSDLDGTTVSLTDYDGQPVAVVFTCCHCPYAVAWEDRINEVARDYEGRAGVVAVNPNAGYLGDSPDDMRQRAAEKGFAFPFLYDERQEAARAYGASRTPEVFVFDTDRRLVYHGAVDDNRDEEGVTQHYLRDAIEAALAGETPQVAETPPVGCTVKWRS